DEPPPTPQDAHVASYPYDQTAANPHHLSAEDSSRSPNDLSHTPCNSPSDHTITVANNNCPSVDYSSHSPYNIPSRVAGFIRTTEIFS
ncbi:hypothetical protein FB192DRAFT_1309437, partial [Mucor lusitanicus]